MIYLSDEEALKDADGDPNVFDAAPAVAADDGALARGDKGL